MSFKVIKMDPFWVYGIGTNTIKSHGKNPIYYSIEDLDSIRNRIKARLERGPVGGYFYERYDVPNLRTKSEKFERKFKYSHQIVDIEVVNNQLKVLVRPAASKAGYALAWIRKNHVQTYAVISGVGFANGKFSLFSVDLIYNRLARSVKVNRVGKDDKGRVFEVNIRIPNAYKQNFFCLDYDQTAKNREEALKFVYEFLTSTINEDLWIIGTGNSVEYKEYEEIEA